MTVNQLIHKLQDVTGVLSSGDIPICYGGKELDLYLFLQQDEQKQYKVELAIEERNGQQ